MNTAQAASHLASVIQEQIKESGSDDVILQVTDVGFVYYDSEAIRDDDPVVWFVTVAPAVIVGA